MTLNDCNDYLYDKLNLLGSEHHTISELNQLIKEMREDLKNGNAMYLLRIRLHELRFQFRRYDKDRDYAELYKLELTTILVKAIEHLETQNN